jgi:pimeloyl-ACP methyl ester carboxylesterase
MATTLDDALEIAVGEQHIAGTLVTPGTLTPGVLFVHGWGGSQQQYIARAREVAALGCICLTFDLRGHARTLEQQKTVTREDNLCDVLAAYDMLTRQRGVDRSSIAVVGSSYGGYLAAILTELRPVRWLVLRVPALYKDSEWKLPKDQLRRLQQLDVYRRLPVLPGDSRALRACNGYGGHALVVQSEHDSIIPEQVIMNYRKALAHGGIASLTHRVLEGADHALSSEPCQHAYTTLLVNWLSEMIRGARSDAETTPVVAKAEATASNEPMLAEASVSRG